MSYTSQHVRHLLFIFGFIVLLLVAAPHVSSAQQTVSSGGGSYSYGGVTGSDTVSRGGNGGEAYSSGTTGSDTVSRGGNGGSSYSGGGYYGSYSSNENRSDSLVARIKAITDMKTRLEALLTEMKNKTKSTGSTSSSTALNAQIAKLTVLAPNGGADVVKQKKNGIKISWQAPRSVAEVDITLKQAGSASTTVIAQGVKHGGGDNSPLRVRKGTYRWKDAPIGTGYTIVVMGTNGSTTLSDTSDSSFAIVSRK